MLFIIFLSMAKNNNPDYRFNKLDIFLSFGGYLSRDNNSKKWKNKMTSLVLPECFLVIFCFRTLLCVALQNKLPVVFFPGPIYLLNNTSESHVVEFHFCRIIVTSVKRDRQLCKQY